MGRLLLPENYHSDTKKTIMAALSALGWGFMILLFEVCVAYFFGVIYTFGAMYLFFDSDLMRRWFAVVGIISVAVVLAVFNIGVIFKFIISHVYSTNQKLRDIEDKLKRVNDRARKDEYILDCDIQVVGGKIANLKDFLNDDNEIKDMREAWRDHENDYLTPVRVGPPKILFKVGEFTYSLSIYDDVICLCIGSDGVNPYINGSFNGNNHNLRYDEFVSALRCFSRYTKTRLVAYIGMYYMYTDNDENDIWDKEWLIIDKGYIAMVTASRFYKELHKKPNITKQILELKQPIEDAYKKWAAAWNAEWDKHLNQNKDDK